MVNLTNRKRQQLTWRFFIYFLWRLFLTRNYPEFPRPTQNGVKFSKRHICSILPCGGKLVICGAPGSPCLSLSRIIVVITLRKNQEKKIKNKLYQLQFNFWILKQDFRKKITFLLQCCFMHMDVLLWKNQHYENLLICLFVFCYNVENGCNIAN